MNINQNDFKSSNVNLITDRDNKREKYVNVVVADLLVAFFYFCFLSSHKTYFIATKRPIGPILNERSFTAAHACALKCPI